MRIGVKAFVAAVCLVAAASARGNWERLGPNDGMVTAIAVTADATQPLYALVPTRTGARLYSSIDGSRWAEHAMPTGCVGTQSDAVFFSWQWLDVRANGDVYLQCDVIYRSRDRGRSWSAFGPRQRVYVIDIDPFDANHAAVSGYDYSPFWSDTVDGGTHWSIAYDDQDNFPTWFAYDPTERGRLVGVMTKTTSVPGGGPGGAFSHTYSLVAVESRDNGRSWSVVESLRVEKDPPAPCFERGFAVDGEGRQYANTDCGLFRSNTRGRQWHRIAAFPGDRLSPLVVSPARPGYVVTFHERATFDSIDAGLTWRQLPPAPSTLYQLKIGAGGVLWGSTATGIVRYDPATRSWESRNAGIYTRHAGTVQAGQGAAATVLNVIIDSSTRLHQSLDAGATWTPRDIGGTIVDQLVRNLTVPASLFAVNRWQDLYESADGGVTWSFVARAATRADDRIGQITPVGPQPGIVYALSARCIDSGFIGCFWQPDQVVRSANGGRTWVPASSVVPVRGTWTLAVSPADSNVLAVNVSDGLTGASTFHITRNAGANWEQLPSRDSAHIVADPVDVARWYRHDYGSLQTSSDFGRTWTDLAQPTEEGTLGLVIDAVDPRRLYVVDSTAALHVSGNRGATWTRVLEPSATLGLYPHSLRIGPEPVTTLYASGPQGVVRLAAPADLPDTRQSMVEFYNASLDHYFMSADAAEIARLDAGLLVGWQRSGQTFTVLRPGAPAASGAFPVCRFYGRPEKGLDSHFFSASIDECNAVEQRFADAWLLETTAAFAIGLPNVVDGSCTSGRAPVFRLYNGRADVNHRYTTSTQVRDEMIARGWLAEGYGAAGVVMCTP